jgi:hypothetical protein
MFKEKKMNEYNDPTNQTSSSNTSNGDQSNLISQLINEHVLGNVPSSINAPNIMPIDTYIFDEFRKIDEDRSGSFQIKNAKTYNTTSW